MNTPHPTTPETCAVLDAILERDGELSERNAPAGLVQLAKEGEISRVAITELNQRLIDRTESHTAQTIRIEDTWRDKLRESQAQVVALRDALTQYREAFSDGPENCGCILWGKVDEIAAAALSYPPPPCVPLAEAQSLADALQSLRDEQNGPPLERHKIHWQEAYDTATRLLNEWDAKHPQPQTA